MLHSIGWKEDLLEQHKHLGLYIYIYCKKQLRTCEVCDHSGMQLDKYETIGIWYIIFISMLLRCCLIYPYAIVIRSPISFFDPCVPL